MEDKPLKVADGLIKKVVKSWLNLPQMGNTEVVYIPHNEGNCGLPPVGNLFDVLTVAHAVRLLNAEDQAAVSILASDTLQLAVEDKMSRASHASIQSTGTSYPLHHTHL